jgi:hypothetical protein
MVPLSSLDVQQIADQRRAVSVGLEPSATESTAEAVQHEVSVSLGIVGHNGWGTHDKTSLTSRYYVWSIPPGFESELGSIPVEGDCGDRNVLGHACSRGACGFYFSKLIPRVILLVFLLVSAAIDGQNDFKFRWLRE